MTNLIQNNDQEIVIPIKDRRGNIFDAKKATAATYVLKTEVGGQELLKKTLGDGISVRKKDLVISISANESKSLKRSYHHECAIVDDDNGKSTIFQNNIYFEPTEI